jgi:hypothetical protein
MQRDFKKRIIAFFVDGERMESRFYKNGQLVKVEK